MWISFISTLIWTMGDIFGRLLFLSNSAQRRYCMRRTWRMDYSDTWPCDHSRRSELKWIKAFRLTRLKSLDTNYSWMQLRDSIFNFSVWKRGSGYLLWGSACEDVTHTSPWHESCSLATSIFPSFYFPSPTYVLSCYSFSCLLMHVLHEKSVSWIFTWRQSENKPQPTTCF